MKKLLILAAILLSCKTDNRYPEEALVTITARNESDVVIRIADNFAMRDSILFSGTTDSTGRLRASLPISSPTFAFLVVNDIESAIYLEPGYNFCVTAPERPDLISQYSGKGSAFNNYLAEAVRKKSLMQNADGKYIYSLESGEFIQRIYDFEQELDALYRNYLDSIEGDEDLGRLMEDWNSISVNVYRQTYSYNYRNQHNYDSDTTLFSTNGFQFSEKLLDLNQPDIGYYLAVHMQESVYAPLYLEVKPEQINSFNATLPVVADSLISSRSYPEKIREFLLARNVHVQLSMSGISDEVERSANNFRKRYPTSRYLKYLDQSFNKWLAISAGKKAPEIRAVGPDGDAFTLSQLKGHVVYVDVWATWCGPCLAEIPHMRKLQQRFASTDSVAFLAVAVDRNTKAWRKMIEREKDWRGIHVIQDGSNGPPEIIRSYNISGIPRYILIDRDGNIVNANASPPSNNLIYQKIRALL